jgi:hypothetical protein
MRTQTDFIDDPNRSRYMFDFDTCSYNNGWVQIDSKQDAAYFGTWANADRRQIVNYAEGDVTIKTADTDTEFVAEIRAIDAWNRDHYKQGVVIDAGLSFERQERYFDLGLGDLMGDLMLVTDNDPAMTRIVASTYDTKKYPRTYLDSKLADARYNGTKHKLFRPESMVVPHSELAMHTRLAGQTIDRILVFYNDAEDARSYDPPTGKARWVIISTTDGDCTDGLYHELVYDERYYDGSKATGEIYEPSHYASQAQLLDDSRQRAI